MKTIKWGIIGAGNISSTFATALNNMENTELAAVASRDMARGKEFASKFNAKKVYDNYEDLAKDEEIDVIYIGTPHSEHVKNAEICIRNKKAVLCEKAFTTNAKEAKYLIELAKEYNVFLMEAMWTKFLPTTIKVKEWIREGKIGNILNLQASFGFRRDMASTHRLLNPNLSGGALLDVGIYPITYAIHIMDKLPICVSSNAKIGETGVDIQNSIIFEFDNGELVTLNSAICAEVGKYAVIIGENGKIEVPLFWSAKEAFLYDEAGKLVDTFKEDTEIKGYEYEAYEVNRCLREGKLESDINPLKVTLDIMEIMDGLRKEWGITYPHEK
jgi:dihydrodiol dehydrogenase / D-xylose 1-dehydrogenase (NADP)